MSRALTQPGTGYPGMWELSDVTRWVSGEASYLGWREGIHSAATPSLRSGGNKPAGGGIGGVSTTGLLPEAWCRLRLMRVEAVSKARSNPLGPTSAEEVILGYKRVQGGVEGP